MKSIRLLPKGRKIYAKTLVPNYPCFRKQKKKSPRPAYCRSAGTSFFVCFYRMIAKSFSKAKSMFVFGTAWCFR